MDFLLKLIETQGLIAAVMVYLIYMNRKDSREDYTGACKRLNLLEDFIHENLMAANNRAAEVIQHNTETQTDVKTTLLQVQSTMKGCQEEAARLRT